MFNDPRVWLALALAFILGWLTDWLVELLYWRGRRLQPDAARLQQRLAAQDARVRELEGALVAQRTTPTDEGARLAQLAEELRASQAELAEAKALLARQAEELDRLRVAQASASVAASEPPTDREAQEEVPPPETVALPEEAATSEELAMPTEEPASVQTPAAGYRLDDEARRIAALLAGRPYEPPPASSTAIQEGQATVPDESSGIAPTAQEDALPASDASEPEPRAGSEAAILRKRTRPRRGSK